MGGETAGRAPRRAAAMNPTSMPNSHLNKNQITGRILIIEDKVRKVCGDGSFREIKFKQTNSCFDASEPVNPRIRPGGHYQTHVPNEELPCLHANGEYVRQIGKPKRANPPNTEFRRFYERGDLPI